MDLEQIRQTDLPIVIFGAGSAGEILRNILADEKISVQCFCDNKKNYSDQGRMINGLAVKYTLDVFQEFPKALYIIAAADIADVVNQLEDHNQPNWIAGGNLLKGVDIFKHPYQAEDIFLEYAVDTCIQCHDAYMNPEKIFLRSVDIVITEKCSLKCKDCSNLMQYYQDPQHYGGDEIVATIDRFLSKVDKVNEFRIIGGEPFMNKEIYRTVERLTAEPKVDRVVIFTNATIVPKGKNLTSLIHPKLLMMITDYDHLSYNHAKLIETLKEHEIGYHTAPAQNWTDCTSIQPHHRTDQQQTNVFNSCCAKTLFTLMDGKLYRCPFSAHIDKLGAMPLFEEDFIDFLRQGDQIEKAEVRSFIFDLPFIKSCDFCVGRRLSDEKITPGIQTKETLEYEIYR